MERPAVNNANTDKLKEPCCRLFKRFAPMAPMVAKAKIIHIQKGHAKLPFRDEREREKERERERLYEEIRR